MFKRRVGKAASRSFVSKHYSSDDDVTEEGERDSGTAVFAPDNVSRVTNKPRLTISFVEDTDGLPAYKKDVRRKEKRQMCKVSEGSTEHPGTLSRAESTNLPVLAPPKVTVDDSVTPLPAAFFNDTNDQEIMFDVSDRVVSASQEAPSVSVKENVVKGFPDRTKFKKEKALKATVADRYDAKRGPVAIDSDEEEWERQQFQKASGGRPQWRVPLHPLDLRTKERINDAEVDNAMRVKSLENVSDPLAKADEYLKALELQYETLEATQKDTEKQRLEAAEAKYSAAERLAALDKSLDCSVELEDFRWVSDLVESMTDLMSEKRLAVSLASQALEGLEKDYAEALRKKKQSYFVKNLNKRSENLQNGNVCAHDRGSTKAVERFGFGKRSSSDASRRTKPTDTLRHRASNSENGKPVMYYDAKGEFQVENVPGWCSEESDTENAVDGNDDDNIVENGDSFFPTRQATTAYKARRADLSRAVVEIFHDVHEEFRTVSVILGRLLDVLQKYPDAFHAVHFNLGIRDVIAFLISWDLLLWDPLFASEYWDLTTSQMVPATLKLKGLRWYSSVLDYVTKLESAFSVFSNEPGSGAMPQKPLDASAHLQQTAEENLMSYIIFKVVAPRLLYWVSNCWDPFSRSQSARVRELLSDIIGYQEALYENDTAALIDAVMKRFESSAKQHIVIQEDTDSEALTFTLWQAAKLARNAVTFSGVLRDQMLRHFVWNVLCMECLRLCFNTASRIKLPPLAAEALIIIAAAPPLCPSQQPPALLLDYLRLHTVDDPTSCLASEIKKLCP